jgi:hypothetical protein
VFRSGWWVAAAAVPVTVFGLWLVITQFNQRSGGPAPLDLGALSCGSPELVDAVAVPSARRSLPAVHDPEVFPGNEIPARNAAKRGKVLVDVDRVVGVVFGGEARAYPLRLLRWHEVVNDTVGGRTIAITYSGLCDAVVVYDRSRLDGTGRLEITGHVLDSNALLTDGASVWRQLSGAPMAGPAACNERPLVALPSAVATWGAWIAAHPESTVMAAVPGMESSYKRDPYHSYFGSDVLHFPVDPLPSDGDRPLKARIAGWDSDAGRTWLHVEEYTSPAVRVGEQTFTLHATSEPATAWIDPADHGAPAMRHAFWFAWYAQFGQTEAAD